MAKDTSIEWSDSTFNPWMGCTKVSDGCTNCYAAVSTPVRAKHIAWGPGQPRVRTSPANWAMPVKWNKWHKEFFARHGRRQRVFCASLADVFDNEVDPQWRADLFHLIMETPHLDWQLLTKRVGNVQRMLDDLRHGADPDLRMFDDGLPDNVWLGATVVNQEEADRDIPKLLEVPAAKRFLSIEPMLGDIRLGSFLQRSPSAAFAAGRVRSDMPAWTRIGSTAIDWVIAGGESGPKARPARPDWFRSLRDQCQAAGVPFLFKQWGEWAIGDPRHHPAASSHWWTANPGLVYSMVKVGKKAAGRLLDGVEHNGFPA